MLVNKTVEFFLSEAAGWTGDLREHVADSEQPGTGQNAGGAGSGLGQDAGDQITGQIADSERPETGRDAGGG